MAFVNIENSSISIQLSGSESVTVPANEVWKVSVVFYSDSSSTSYLKVNDKRVAYANNTTHNVNFNTFFTGGDTIVTELGSNNRGVHISGFVVQQQS